MQLNRFSRRIFAGALRGRICFAAAAIFVRASNVASGKNGVVI